MAAYQDLVDAIAHVRACTGDPEAWMRGLSGADLAVASSPVSVAAPGAVDAVLGRIRAAHPGLFDPRTGAPVTPPPSPTEQRPEGAAAEAIHESEAALARQQSVTAQLDLQVVTAVLNAHSTHAAGRAGLDALQRDIENAVLTRPDLDTPAGARSFQRYLAGKVRDIRAVVDTADLDSGSKAALAAALASLYASPAGEDPASPPRDRVTPAPRAESSGAPAGGGTPRSESGAGPATADPFFDDPLLAGSWSPDAAPPPAGLPTAPAPAPPALAPPAMTSMVPPIGGAALPSSAAPLGSGLPLPSGPLFPGLAGALDRPAAEDVRAALEPDPDASEQTLADLGEEPGDEPLAQSEDPPGEADATTVRLPGGETVTAASPALAAAITAAVGGTPIADAFRQQGITIAPPGSAVAQPVEPGRLAVGDIGVLADRHALALGNGKALLDGRIQPVTSVMGPEFLGWERPPTPAATAPLSTVGAPTPTRPAVTAGPPG